MQHLTPSPLDDLRSTLQQIQGKKSGKKSKRITVNLYPDEFERVKNWAGKTKLADYCRTRILGRDYSKVPEINRRYLVELSRCNGLLNQIARGINTAIRWRGTPIISREVLDEIKANQALLKQHLAVLIQLQKGVEDDADCQSD